MVTTTIRDSKCIKKRKRSQNGRLIHINTAQELDRLIHDGTVIANSSEDKREISVIQAQDGSVYEVQVAYTTPFDVIVKCR